MFPALFARWLLKNNEDFKARGAKFIHNAPYVLAQMCIRDRPMVSGPCVNVLQDYMAILI